MPDEIKQNGSVIPNASETFGTIPKPSEPFGNVPNVAEAFRTVPNGSERKENHTLTVRETARMFEAAGVARTERSIVNWCQPNRTGIARLDAYYDPNERRYFIAHQSVDLAIAEEKAKAVRIGDSVSDVPGKSPETPAPENKVPKPSEAFGTSQPDAETNGGQSPRPASPESTKRISELEKEVIDLKITNRAKDYFIDELKRESEKFSIERHGFINKLMSFTRRVGQMETRLLQLGTPKEELDAISSIDKEFSEPPEAKQI